MTFTETEAFAAAPEVVETRDGSRTLRQPEGEGYKSLAGALTEARSVYLEASGVAARLRAGTPARVLEIGFGTGLLFLVSAALAQSSDAKLDYVGVEQAPPYADLLESLGYADLLAPSTLPNELVSWRRSLGARPEAGRHYLTLGGIHLNLHVGDALTFAPEGTFDAIYHDAFSPRTNPDLWTASFLSALAELLRPGGRLVSFTVAGSVRRALTEAGLSVTKTPGPPGGKREVLLAERPA